MAAALALLAWTLAHWTWVFLTPAQTSDAILPAPGPSAAALAEKLAALHLLGAAAGAVHSDAPAASMANIQVSGVYAGGARGFAVMTVEGKATAAIVGREFAPGMTLRAVYGDRIEIQRGGRVETIPVAKSPAAPAAASAAAPGLNLEVRELGDGRFGLSRSRLLLALRSPEQMALLGRFGAHPRGGALLERSPAGGLPEKLGLKVGDVMTGMNGKPFTGVGDVMKIYEQLLANDSVRLEVLRAGEKMNLELQVAP